MRNSSAEIYNVDYQQRLAATLVSNQGLDGAIRSCQEFGWEGVLDRLKVQEPAQKSDTRERSRHAR